MSESVHRKGLRKIMRNGKVEHTATTMQDALVKLHTLWLGAVEAGANTVWLSKSTWTDNKELWEIK